MESALKPLTSKSTFHCLSTTVQGVASRNIFQLQESGKSTYRALKKKSNQVKIGRTGKKNCLVIGMSRAPISNDAAPVFTNGLGAWLTESEKTLMMINIRYWPS